MTYTKTFNSKKFEEISSLTDKLTSLKPGQRLEISSLSREGLQRTRWLLYDWLSWAGLKPLFRLNLWLDEGKLSIKRLGEGSMTCEITSPSLGPLDEMLKTLVCEAPTEGQAQEVLLEWISEKSLGLDEAAKLLKRWKEVYNK